VERRLLGTSGLEVSRLSLGAMTFGSKMPPISNTDQAAAEALLERAVDAGINLVDTADVYSRGESEEILAPVLARHRDRLQLATKVGWGRMHERPLGRENVIASVEDSLRRLGVDRIDVLYVHRPDRTTPIEETFDALDTLVERGLVCTIGVSNWTAGEIGYTVGRQRALERAEPTSVQVYWSLVGREVEQEIVPACSRLNVGVVVWSPLAGGFLADRRDGRRLTHAFPPVDETLGAKALEALRGVAAESGTTPAAVAIAWLLARPDVTSVIIGASRLEQLEANLAAADLKLDASQLRALDDATAIDPIYPRWWDAAMGVPS
jgi:aryl-alcohol dehydrogenase-like predicted oxidoreductase